MALSFFESVWKQLEKIPEGRVSTYGAVAVSLGKPGAARAVGNACNKNPFSPRVPCHRVVASDGRIGGFAGGSAEKERLLKKEGIRIQNGLILDLEGCLFRF